MLLSFNVQKQIITRTDTESVVCNSMNFLYAQFTFSEEWTGTKTAVFKGKEKTYNALLDENDTCLVPWEVLTESWFYVSVFCDDLITANKVTIYTIPSGYEIGDESRVPTPEIYIQVIEKLNEIESEVDPDAIKRTVDDYIAEKGLVTEDDVDQIVADYVEAHKSEWTGSVVSVTQTLSSGTKIAEIDVDGNSVDLFAPEGGGSASSLSDLSDTSISSPSSGDVLVYDGEKWVNENAEEAVNPYSDLAFTLNEKGYVEAKQSKIIVTQGSQWKYSTPIAVTAGQHIKFTASGFNVNVAMISTCDENGGNISVKIISEVNPNTSDYWYRDYEYDVIADGYIIVSCNTNGGTPILQVKNAPITFKNIISTNVFKGICHSFKKVLCVGDSYTQGMIFQYSGSTSIIAPEYSWVQHMNTLTGNEWINCGVSGATSKTWRSNSNGLAKAQTEGVVQAYIIGLGINDSNSTIADYLPVGAISDIGTNNDTYYAQLSKVIEELATISPEAFIFVNTCPYREKERIAPYNVAIKNIVEHFKNTYKIHCIDLAGYYSDLFYSPDFVGMFYQSHPTVEGHATIAKMYEFALSDYMRQNEVPFRNIPWTPYDT